MTKISVIVPAYNQAHFLRDALNSVLEQDYENFELIVVDDGSTDDTRSTVHELSDERISYHRQDNAGLSAARNAGMRMSSGSFLTFLDADDMFLPSKLSIMLDAFSNEPSLGFVAGQAIPINERGERVGRVFDRGLPEPIERFLLGNPFHVGSVMLRREWKERVGYFDEDLRSYEDWDYWIRLALAGCPMGWVDKPVSLYRFHQAQMTRHGAQMTGATFSVLNKVFYEPDLPDRWRALRNEGYSRAHLRAAAQDFLAAAFDQANAHLGEAVKLNPGLLENGARSLSDHFMAWTELPKTGDALRFLDRIYSNLSDRFLALKLRRHSELGKAAARIAFEAYKAGDLRRARRAILAAFRHEPGRLRDRGALSVLLGSYRIVPQ